MRYASSFAPAKTSHAICSTVDLARRQCESFELDNNNIISIHLTSDTFHASFDSVRLILRLYDADTGSVAMDGINVKAMQQTSLRSNIGVVAQETILFHSSLRENSACDPLSFLSLVYFSQPV